MHILPFALSKYVYDAHTHARTHKHTHTCIISFLSFRPFRKYFTALNFVKKKIFACRNAHLHRPEDRRHASPPPPLPWARAGSYVVCVREGARARGA